MQSTTTSTRKSAKLSSTKSTELTLQGWQRVKDALTFARADDQKRHSRPRSFGSHSGAVAQDQQE
jgi:hypothetical protein